MSNPHLQNAIYSYNEIGRLQFSNASSIRVRKIKINQINYCMEKAILKFPHLYENQYSINVIFYIKYLNLNNWHSLMGERTRNIFMAFMTVLIYLQHHTMTINAKKWKILKKYKTNVQFYLQ